jgi:hypothetical protein
MMVGRWARWGQTEEGLGITGDGELPTGKSESIAGAEIDLGRLSTETRPQVIQT